MRRREGFTLVEVVIAIAMFAIGGLGLAAASAAVAKQISTTTIRERALVLARSRAETAAGVSCGLVTSGEAEVPGISLAWTAGSGRARTIDQRVTRVDSRGTFPDRFLSAVLCE